MNKRVAFVRPVRPVSWHLLWHRYFLPFSLLRYSLRSPPTPACATVRVWKVCVQRVCELSRFTAGQISRYTHVASAPPPPIVR